MSAYTFRHRCIICGAPGRIQSQDKPSKVPCTKAMKCIDVEACKRRLEIDTAVSAAMTWQREAQQRV